MAYHATLQLGLGALQRQNPLPVGVYAFTNVLSEALPNSHGYYARFKSWIQQNQANVKVRATETSHEPFDGKPTTADLYVFEVKVPTAWPAAEIGGYPDIVEGSVADAVKKYGQGDGGQYWWDWVSEKLSPPTEEEEAALVTKIVLLAAGVGAGYYVLKNMNVFSKKEARA
jgi:hypothetical protein